MLAAEGFATGILHVEHIEALTGPGSEDARAGRVAAGGGDRQGEIGEKAPAVGCADNQFDGVAIGTDARLRSRSGSDAGAPGQGEMSPLLLAGEGDEIGVLHT